MLESFRELYRKAHRFLLPDFFVGLKGRVVAEKSGPGAGRICLKQRFVKKESNLILKNLEILPDLV